MFRKPRTLDYINVIGAGDVYVLSPALPPSCSKESLSDMKECLRTTSCFAKILIMWWLALIMVYSGSQMTV